MKVILIALGADRLLPTHADIIFVNKTREKIRIDYYEGRRKGS